MKSSTISRLVALLWAVLLSMAAPLSSADDADVQIEFIEIMTGYLDVTERIVALASTQEASVYFAVEGIVEIYEDRGELARAIPHLRKVLEQYPDNRAVRNIVRFKLRDVYKETGQADLALQELEAVIQENR